MELGALMMKLALKHNQAAYIGCPFQKIISATYELHLTFCACANLNIEKSLSFI